MYQRSVYVEKYKNKECTFYILECFNDIEKFYKIGITSSTIKNRYKSKKSMPYNYNIILELKNTVEYIWDLEQKLKQNLINNYKPLIPFGGSYLECFSNKEEIFSLL